MTDQQKQLKEFLLDSGLISEADYNLALDESLKNKSKFTK